MSAYNYLHIRMACPRRGHLADMEIECFFGLRDFSDYQKGDVVKWVDRKAVHNGGRPTDGNMDGEGYLQCPICDLDAFVKVLVRNDVIVGVGPDSDRKPFKPDPNELNLK